jgi:hypothetical protein
MGGRHGEQDGPTEDEQDERAASGRRRRPVGAETVTQPFISGFVASDGAGSRMEIAMTGPGQQRSKAELTADIRARRRTALVVNVRSRRGRRHFPAVCRLLRAAGLDPLDLRPVADPRHLAGALAEAADSGADLIVVGAGDGTLSEAKPVLLDDQHRTWVGDPSKIERAAMDALLDGARSRRGGAQVLRGLRGVGESALLADAAARATGVQVLRVVGIKVARCVRRARDRRGSSSLTWPRGYGTDVVERSFACFVT